MSEVRDLRLDHLEEGMREVKAVLGRLEPLIVRIDQRLTSELPTLATKAELADVRAEIYRTMLTHTLVIVGALISGLGLLFAALHYWPPHG